MASKQPVKHEFTEHCEACGRQTRHTVSVRLVTESTKSDNAEFSREPYRITECSVCGETKNQRMNNA
ncbi:MAG: hypothetical protein ABEJ70_05465 [Halobacteriaceae archaeon]